MFAVQQKMFVVQHNELQQLAMFICCPETRLPMYWLHFLQSQRVLLYTDH